MERKRLNSTRNEIQNWDDRVTIASIRYKRRIEFLPLIKKTLRRGNSFFTSCNHCIIHDFFIRFIYSQVIRSRLLDLILPWSQSFHMNFIYPRGCGQIRNRRFAGEIIQYRNRKQNSWRKRTREISMLKFKFHVSKRTTRDHGNPIKGTTTLAFQNLKTFISWKIVIRVSRRNIRADRVVLSGV